MECHMLALFFLSKPQTRKQPKSVWQSAVCISLTIKISKLCLQKSSNCLRTEATRTEE